MAAIQYVTDQAKSIINKQAHIDDWSWSSYTWNSYRGCTFGCVYCDARAERYGIGPDFSSVIHVKGNAGDLADRQLRRMKFGIVSTGGVCDAYQPGEGTHRVTRSVVQSVLEHGFPILIRTKSVLVLRDHDLLREINAKCWAGVCFTITTTNREHERIFEPGTPPAAGRFLAMERLAKSGIQVGLTMLPLLPGITDTDENMDALVRRARDAGASYVQPGTLTLKRGTQKRTYLNVIAQHFPQLLPMYQQLYADDRIGPTDEYWRRIISTAAEVCRFYGLPDRMFRPHLPDSPRWANQRIAELLFIRSSEASFAGENQYAVRAFRTAALAIEDMEPNIVRLYEVSAIKGLQMIPGVGKKIAELIEGWLQAEGFVPAADGAAAA